ncbi:hypothetical protein L6452_05786 [Arctium lappa]|uniref:Uncharacterized protein n=1 Tax=Arctium lappa TaxID=4217 RepID=A0ACB9EI20_ARCLA|nr:hypothetical protein L6452_05786 [Arctium lappa]
MICFKLDAVNTTLEGIGRTLSSVHDEEVNNTAAIQNHSQALKDLIASLTSKAESEQIHGLQQVMDKLQSNVTANTTSLPDLRRIVVAGLVVASTSTPSPRVDEDKEGEKNVEYPSQADGEKETEKKALSSLMRKMNPPSSLSQLGKELNQLRLSQRLKTN